MGSVMLPVTIPCVGMSWKRYADAGFDELSHSLFPTGNCSPPGRFPSIGAPVRSLTTRPPQTSSPTRGSHAPLTAWYPVGQSTRRDCPTVHARPSAETICTRKLPGRSNTMVACPLRTSKRVACVKGSSSTADAEPRLESCSVLFAVKIRRLVLAVALSQTLRGSLDVSAERCLHSDGELAGGGEPLDLGGVPLQGLQVNGWDRLHGEPPAA